MVTNLVRANAAAYDAIHAFDRRARVGPVHNMIAFTPADPGLGARPARGAAHADYLFNRLYLNAVVRGREDLDVDGRVAPGERHPERAGKADFIGAELLLPQPRDRPRRLDQQPHQAARLPAAELLRARR